MCSGHGALTPLTWRPQMVRAHKAQAHIWVRKQKQECGREYGEEGCFLDMLLSLHEPDINPSSNYIHVQNSLTDSFFSLHRRRLSRFSKGFSLICWIPFASWRLLFWQVQNTHQFVPSLYRQHFVEFATPPEKNPQKESGEMCHIPHDAHSYDNEDSQCRFFFLRQCCAEVVWGCVTCQHLHPVEASWQRSPLMLMLTLPLDPLFSMPQLFQCTFCLVSLSSF